MRTKKAILMMGLLCSMILAQSYAEKIEYKSPFVMCTTNDDGVGKSSFVQSKSNEATVIYQTYNEHGIFRTGHNSIGIRTINTDSMSMSSEIASTEGMVPDLAIAGNTLIVVFEGDGSGSTALYYKTGIKDEILTSKRGKVDLAGKSAMNDSNASGYYPTVAIAPNFIRKDSRGNDTKGRVVIFFQKAKGDDSLIYYIVGDLRDDGMIEFKKEMHNFPSFRGNYAKVTILPDGRVFVFYQAFTGDDGVSVLVWGGNLTENDINWDGSPYMIAERSNTPYAYVKNNKIIVTYTTSDGLQYALGSPDIIWRKGWKYTTAGGNRGLTPPLLGGDDGCKILLFDVIGDKAIAPKKKM